MLLSEKAVQQTMFFVYSMSVACFCYWKVLNFVKGGNDPPKIIQYADILETRAGYGIQLWPVRITVKVAQSCLTLCDPMDYTVYGILQARRLEWVAGPFSRGSSQLRDQTQVSLIAGGFFTSWPPGEAPRILEWVAYPFSSRSSWPRNRTRVSCIAGGFFTSWATRKAHLSL